MSIDCSTLAKNSSSYNVNLLDACLLLCCSLFRSGFLLSALKEANAIDKTFVLQLDLLIALNQHLIVVQKRFVDVFQKRNGALRFVHGRFLLHGYILRRSYQCSGTLLFESLIA